MMPEQSDHQELEKLVLRYPEKAMELLALRGVAKFVKLYKRVTGIQLKRLQTS